MGFATTCPVAGEASEAATTDTTPITTDAPAAPIYIWPKVRVISDVVITLEALERIGNFTE